MAVNIKPLDQTFVFKNMNKDNVITNNIIKLLQHGKVLTKDNLEEAFMVINKHFKYPLKITVMQLFDQGRIRLMYSPDNVKLPITMPFFLTRGDDGRPVCVVAVDLYGTMDKESGNVKIDPKKLYCMMESGCFALKWLNHYKEISANTSIIANGSKVYSGMFTRVLNKKYALNTDKNKLHKVLFLSSKFFLMNLLGKEDSDLVTNYALKNCPNGNDFILKEVNESFPVEAYDDMSKFITELATNQSLGLNFKDLTVRGYLESYITMYDAAALFALESFPYFFYNVMAVTSGAYINNQYILEDIVEHYGGKMYVNMSSGPIE